eukprot:3658307-Pyramimonas_sp.AAC.1
MSKKYQRTNIFSARASSDLSTQQTNAPNASGSASVRTSSVALLQPELIQKMGNICQEDSENRNSFADLARVADPVQTSACNSRTDLMIPNQFLCA